MLRVVLDTNVLISAIGWRGHPRKVLALCIDGKLTLMQTQEMLKEFERVLQRARFTFIHAEKKQELLRYLIDISIKVTPKENVEVIKEDPDDNKFLDCAVAGKADYIVSGDRHLLKLKEHKGIKIVTASGLLKVLI
ncbi:MAG: putative toxin-antitoxin system toxin component, PIN family [Candidatus Hydrothermarchaeales archaeon]